MTAPLPPSEQARLAALERERNPDPRALLAERERPIPPPPGVPVPARKRGEPLAAPQPAARSSYVSTHAALREWLRAEHPYWHPELCTLGDASAHVIIEWSPRRALALCGADGAPHVASDLARPCEVCSSFRPRDRSA